MVVQYNYFAPQPHPEDNLISLIFIIFFKHTEHMFCSLAHEEQMQEILLLIGFWHLTHFLLFVSITESFKQLSQNIISFKKQ